MKRTGMTSRRVTLPSTCFSTTLSCCTSLGPSGTTMRPPGASWPTRAKGGSFAAAVTRILSNGACSAHPREPSPTLSEMPS